MPIVHVEMMPGRTPEQKRALIRDITEAVVKNAGAPPQAVRVILTEVPPEHWAVAGVAKADEPKK